MEIVAMTRASSPSIREFYNSLDKCTQENCSKYTLGVCDYIDTAPHDICIKRLYTKFMSSKKENTKLKTLLNNLHTKLSTIDTKIEISFSSIQSKIK